VTLQFPAVLERLALPAFDLCKLVGPFVRHAPALPRELKRHLFSIEERVRSGPAAPGAGHAPGRAVRARRLGAQACAGPDGWATARARASHSAAWGGLRVL
jgi:hypothetical protein